MSSLPQQEKKKNQARSVQYFSVTICVEKVTVVMLVVCMQARSKEWAG